VATRFSEHRRQLEDGFISLEDQPGDEDFFMCLFVDVRQHDRLTPVDLASRDQRLITGKVIKS
jgi:hypothetical protein